MFQGTFLIDTPVTSSQPCFPTPIPQQPTAGTNSTPALLPGLIARWSSCCSYPTALRVLGHCFILDKKIHETNYCSQAATAIQNPKLPPISLELMKDDQCKSNPEDLCEPAQEHVYSELRQEGIQYATPIDQIENP